MDCGASSAEYIYGTTLRIPGELVLPDDFSPDTQVFLKEFRQHMRAVKSVPVEHRHKRNIFVHKDLSNYSHVFLRANPSRKSLEPPYTGPHRVVNRLSDRVIEIEVNKVVKSVSLENVKPAHIVHVRHSNTYLHVTTTQILKI